jgi:uncharacterized LabA/DUF88 family protein
MIRYSDQRVGVFIDVPNLYHSAKHLFQAKVNFKRLVEFLVSGRKLIRAIAYDVDTQQEDKDAFLNALQSAGIEVKSKPLQSYPGGIKKGDWDVGITVDSIKLARVLDAVIICTGDGDYVPLIRYLKENFGCLVEVAGFRASSSSALIGEADYFFDISQYPKKFLIAPKKILSETSH